jgi:alpha-tubulin suppressor-like RCC1 family protein
MLAVGDNAKGKLGTGTPFRARTPAPVQHLSDPINDVVVSNEHTLFFSRHAQKMLRSGAAADGVSATSTPINMPLPELPSGVRFERLWGAWNSAYLLDSSGQLWGAGSNLAGQLGTGDVFPRGQFTSCPINEPIVDVRCGQYHALALSASGHVYACGLGRDGQLGRDDISQTSLFERIPFFGGMQVTALACGLHHSAVATARDGVFVFGAGNRRAARDPALRKVFAQPTVVVGGPRVSSDSGVRLVAGAYHTLMVCDGSLWGVGSNADGQLGNGDRESREARFVPVVVPPSCGDVEWDSLQCGWSYAVALTHVDSSSMSNSTTGT